MSVISRWWYRNTEYTDWVEAGLWIFIILVVAIGVIAIGMILYNYHQRVVELTNAGCTHQTTNLTRDRYIVDDDWSCPYKK